MTHHKVLVLLTDGEDNDSESGALAAAQNAAKDGLKIFTIGIGTAAGDLIRVTDANGNSDYVRDEQGNVVKSHLNETLLQQIAGATGGFYLPLRGADTMDMLYERGLAPLPKSEGVARTDCGVITSNFNGRWRWRFCFCWRKCFCRSGSVKRRSPETISKTGIAKTAVTGNGFVRFARIRHFASPASALRDYKSGQLHQRTDGIFDNWRKSRRTICVWFSMRARRRIARRIMTRR